MNQMVTVVLAAEGSVSNKGQGKPKQVQRAQIL